MTPREKRSDWIKYLEVANYPLEGLMAILRLDGEEMLSGVLKDLGVVSSLDLVKWARDRGK